MLASRSIAPLRLLFDALARVDALQDLQIAFAQIVYTQGKAALAAYTPEKSKSPAETMASALVAVEKLMMLDDLTLQVNVQAFGNSVSIKQAKAKAFQRT